jgi:hypothetical protein
MRGARRGRGNGVSDGAGTSGLSGSSGAGGPGQGAGTEAVALLARYLFEERGHHRITIDPAARNERAIRGYATVGFRPGSCASMSAAPTASATTAC